MSVLEMSDWSCFTVGEGIPRLREIGTLEWICHSRLSFLHEEGAVDTLFTTTLRNKFVRRTLASWKSSVIAFSCRLDLTVGNVITEMGILKVVGIIGSLGGRDQVAESTTKARWVWLP